jgi:copper homeostasis protein
MFVLEVCVDSVASAIKSVISYCSAKLILDLYNSAEAGGASRLELCGNLGIGGGTTPSIGLLRAIRKVLPSIPIMVRKRQSCGQPHKSINICSRL